MTSKSAAKLIPVDPAKVMVMRDITPNLTTLSTPFSAYGMIKVGIRGTVVKLQTGALAVFSPVALTPDVQSKIRSMGNKVKYLSALNIEHHIFLTPWALAYPDAQIIGVEGLPEKRDRDPATSGLKFSHIFTKSNKLDHRISDEFDEEFSYEYIHSHRNGELVFFHQPTKTMIQADLIFNPPATEQYSRSGESPTSGILTGIFNGFMGIDGEALWQRRWLYYTFGASDRAGFAESVKRMDRWDVQRVIPCHGDVIESGGKGVFDKMMSWYRERGKR
jgi:Domain of unknown function (DUF4336)